MTDTMRMQPRTSRRRTRSGSHGWWSILASTWRAARAHNMNIVAAGLAFYAFLAFVPLLAALVLTYGLVAEPATIIGHVRALTQLMPADAAMLVGDQLMSMSETAESQKGLGLALAILLSIYGAMRGASSLITALNFVYDVEDGRGFVRTTFTSLALTIGAVCTLLLAVLAISSLAYVEALLPASHPYVHDAVRVGFWIGAALAISLFVAVIYRFAPDREGAHWEWLTPGAIVVTLLWLGATLGFGFYVSNFGNYNATYGSLGAVIVFLTWLYLSAYILLLGGELNAEVERRALGF
jgi:membrane protein